MDEFEIISNTIGTRVRAVKWFKERRIVENGDSDKLSHKILLV